MRYSIYLLAADFSFLRHRLQTRYNGHQKRHHDRRCYVRIDPHRSNAKIPHGAAAEQVEHAKQLVTVEEVLEGLQLYAGNWNMRNEPKYNQYYKSKYQLLPEVRETK